MFLAYQPRAIDESSLIPMTPSFESYSDYHRTIHPLLYLELWAKIQRDTEGSSCSQQYRLHGVDEVSRFLPISPIGRPMMKIRCHAAVTADDMAKNNLPRYGDLVKLQVEVQGTEEDRASQKNGKIFVKTMFAFVCNVSKQEARGRLLVHRDLLAVDSRPVAYKVSYKLYARSTEYHIKIEKLMGMKIASRIRPELRLLQSLEFLNASPLCNHILDPIKQDFTLGEARRQTFTPLINVVCLNELQKQAILKISHACLMRETKICMIQGPPGTGKSHVIVNIITQILYGQNTYSVQRRGKKLPRILLCAQSNAAVDALVTRLRHIRLQIEETERFRMVRIGNMENMSHKVRGFSAQELAKKDVNKSLLMRAQSMEMEINECKANLNSLKQVNKKNKEYIRQTQMKLLELETNSPVTINKHKAKQNSLKQGKQKNKEYIRQIQMKLPKLETNSPVTINKCKAKLNSLEQAKQINEKYIREIQEKLSQLEANLPVTTDEIERMEEDASLKIANGADIVATTLRDMDILFSQNESGDRPRSEFSCCIIDEATQSQELETLIPLMFGVTTLVLVGDAQQLPATFSSVKAKENGLYKPLFERIQECFKDARENPIYKLDIQYRMHPEICLWPNRYLYDGKLRTPSNFISHRSCALVPYCVLNLQHTQNSSSEPPNRGEAQLIKELAVGILEIIGQPLSLTIITLYNEQRAMIVSLLPPHLQTNIEVKTVENFQGQERDIIILSVDRTAGVGMPKNLNVALTRARRSLILCGDFSLLKSDFAWRLLLKNAEDRRVLKHVPAAISENRDELVNLVKQ